MDALVGGEVQGTFSRSPGFGLALPRAQADQAGGEDLADLVQAFGGRQQRRIVWVDSVHWEPGSSSSFPYSLLTGSSNRPKAAAF